MGQYLPSAQGSWCMNGLVCSIWASNWLDHEPLLNNNKNTHPSVSFMLQLLCELWSVLCEISNLFITGSASPRALGEELANDFRQSKGFHFRFLRHLLSIFGLLQDMHSIPPLPPRNAHSARRNTGFLSALAWLYRDTSCNPPHLSENHIHRIKKLCTKVIIKNIYTTKLYKIIIMWNIFI